MKPPLVTEIQHIQSLLKIDIDTYYDYRGCNFEAYNKEVYEQAHPLFKTLEFPIDSFSQSRKNVIRGFHGDTSTYKLIQCLYGEIQLVIIDCRQGTSPTFGNSYTFFLRGNRPQQILVPAGCVNAHLCLSEECVFSYKLSHAYVSQDQQIHVPWSKYDQWLLTSRAILSIRDEEVTDFSGQVLV